MSYTVQHHGLILEVYVITQHTPDMVLFNLIAATGDMARTKRCKRTPSNKNLPANTIPLHQPQPMLPEVWMGRSRLPEALSMVPDFLPCYLLSMWKSTRAGIQSLRLVSKEVSRIALRAVTSCSVKLGHWEDPDPGEVALTMCSAQLATFELVVKTFPGEMGCDARSGGSCECVA